MAERDRAGQAGEAIARIGGAATGGFLGPIIGPEAAAAAGQALMETTDIVIPFLTERVNQRIRTLSDHARAETKRRREEGGVFREDGLIPLRPNCAQLAHSKRRQTQ